MNDDRRGSCAERWLRLVAAVLVAGYLAPAFAGTINTGAWSEFSFIQTGTAAGGCDPADPNGGFCISSSGTPTQFLDAPPWTFAAPQAGIVLTVTDAFLSGDRFEVFDFGASLGQTSAPVEGFDCGDDPVPCVAAPAVSHRSFQLGAGNHSVTIVPASVQGAAARGT